MNGLWRWLRDFANRRVREAYMRRHKHDRMCLVCKTWMSEVGGCAEVTQDSEWTEITRCLKCNQWTRWDMRSMLPFAADYQPFPRILPSPLVKPINTG